MLVFIFFISCRLAKVRNEVFFHISFKGTHYSGWQRQTKGIASIQEELENALHKVTGSETPVMGCGRTDAGVCIQFFAHFDASTCPISLNQLYAKAILWFIRFSGFSRMHMPGTMLCPEPMIILSMPLKNAFQDELSFLYGGKILFSRTGAWSLWLHFKNQDFKSFCKKTPERHKSTVWANIYMNVIGNLILMKGDIILE